MDKVDKTNMKKSYLKLSPFVTVFCLFLLPYFSPSLHASFVDGCNFKAQLLSLRPSASNELCTSSRRKTFEIEVTGLAMNDNMVVVKENNASELCNPFLSQTKNNQKMKVIACGSLNLEFKKEMWIDFNYTYSVGRGGQESKSFEVESEYLPRLARKKMLSDNCRATRSYTDCSLAAEYFHFDKDEAPLEEAYINMCSPGPGGCQYLINFYLERTNTKRLEGIAQKLEKQCESNNISACELCGSTYDNLNNSNLAEKCMRRACDIEKKEIKWRHDACRALNDHFIRLKK